MDRLRIVSIFLVMVAHVAAAFFPYIPAQGADYLFLGFYNALSRLCVPCLVMVSGALLLDESRTESIGYVLKKRVLRMVLTLAGWTIAYAAVRTGVQFVSGLRGAELCVYALDCLKAPMHLWYLYMLIGLYLILPILRGISRISKLRRYFLILSFLFAVFIPTVRQTLALFAISLPDRSENLSFVLGYAGYFLLGRELMTMDIKKNAECRFYVLGAMGLCISVGGTLLPPKLVGKGSEIFLESLSLGQYLTSAAVFVLFRQHAQKESSENGRALRRFLNENSFGMYLTHLFFNEAFITFGITALVFSPLISVPLLSIAIFMMSLGFTVLIRKIPVIRTYFT